MSDSRTAAVPLPPEQGAAAASVLVLRQLVKWDAEGNPIVENTAAYTKASLNDLYMVAAAQPYTPMPGVPEDAQYAGMTIAEVMVRKQVHDAARTGNAEAVMDRLLGRPKQSVESTKMVLTYEDHLKEIERKEQLKTRAIEATVVAREAWEDL